MNDLVARWRAATEATRFIVGVSLIILLAGLVLFASNYL
jgi:hypothetical protein